MKKAIPLSIFVNLVLYQLSCAQTEKNTIGTKNVISESTIIVVTFAGNVSLNNSLENFNLKTSSSVEIKLKRTSFAGRLNRLNMIRTVLSSTDFILLIIACIKIA
ncbi:MAG: DUF1772 domain-containing protein [Ignavibacterium sp.]|nr:MAG: DUF1772 domain-containing protein [Ignavibacterium sp.]